MINIANKLFSATLLLISLIVAAGTATAQTSVGVTPDMRIKANELFQKENWNDAIPAYENILKYENKNAGAHYRLGVSLLNIRRNEDGVRNLEIAIQLSPNPVFALALARGYAAMHRDEMMYATFEKLISYGGVSPSLIEAEAEFARFRTEPRFTEVVKRCRLLANPCEARPEYRQFDFWIGEWLPKNAQGVTVGTSSIQLILGSCIIFENWSTPVSSGKSFNLYDTRDGKWHQTWVDNKGLMTEYVGGLVDGKMVLTTDTVRAGRKTIAKMTFSKLENGDVRQHGENSVDEGKTWTTSFDFTYVRKPTK